MANESRLANVAHRNARAHFKVMLSLFRFEQCVAKQEYARLRHYLKQEEILWDRRQLLASMAAGKLLPRLSTGGVGFAPHRALYTGRFNAACAKRAVAKAAARGAKRALLAAAKRLAAARAAAM